METTSPELEPLLQHQNRNDEHRYRGRDEESFSFADSSTNNDFDSDSDSDDEDNELKEKRAQRLKETGGWSGYLKDFSIFLPYLVPRKDLKVQLCIVGCILCLAGQRVLNILIPHQLGIVADKLLDHTPPYKELVIWLVFTVINDRCGLGLILELALIPVKQFGERSVTNAAFSHVLDLSMDFHSERDSAEVMKALEQGSSLTRLLETIVCESLPTVVDVSVAIGILYWKFDIYISLVMLVACTSYLSLEIFTSRWKVEPRRQYARASRQEARVMHQAIQGWTTVSYFNMFRFERERFRKTVEAKLVADRKWSMIADITRGVVELLLPITFFTLASMALYNISKGRSKPGDFVFFIQYWESLIWPLTFLSHEYRQIMSDLIDAERLLALLQQKPTVVDREGAHEISPGESRITFEDVVFAYDDRKTTIRDLNFSAEPGQTVALVGATGAGKSTVTKLLLRFYDITSGRISIDGYDIRDVTLDSLRNIIGVVPQDPLLFNGTILENLRYAKPSATFNDIISACRAASIHDKVQTFADGYKTRVGENGVKLSGGEVQRLAVARVMLKDPPILILDEATSAIDTHTESEIQRALDAFQRRRKRTTFVIAHRLSTIVRANQILVFDEGRVVETGTHEELIKRNGVYNKLWSRQTGLVQSHETP
ncbi:hypothetical protein N0V90_010024 [Kalmusia sp. IMI 367209]|nr:hypothetical protein N0V90_010024 [Kalmusia sp. IMI 367209]